MQGDEMTAKTKKSAATKPDQEELPQPKSNTIRAEAQPGETRDQIMAKLAATGVVGNARTMVLFGEPTYGELSLGDCMTTLAETAGKVDGGDLSSLVTMLSSQAAALNTIFGELSRRASFNMGSYPDAFERYMRMALRAQGQCRATLETLAAIKNPPFIVARQANIAHGPQQVNNGTAAGASGTAPTHAPQSNSSQSGLLEASSGEWLDSGATGAAGRGNPQVAPVGAVNGTKDQRGEG